MIKLGSLWARVLIIILSAPLLSNILISSNHLYAFACLSIIGILAYRNNKKINLLIYYLFEQHILKFYFYCLYYK